MKRRFDTVQATNLAFPVPPLDGKKSRYRSNRQISLSAGRTQSSNKEERKNRSKTRRISPQLWDLQLKICSLASHQRERDAHSQHSGSVDASKLFFKKANTANLGIPRALSVRVPGSLIQEQQPPKTPHRFLVLDIQRIPTLFEPMRKRELGS